MARSVGGTQQKNNAQVCKCTKLHYSCPTGLGVFPFAFAFHQTHGVNHGGSNLSDDAINPISTPWLHNLFTHIHTHAHRVGSQDAAAGAVLLPVSVLLRNPPEGVKKGTGLRLILFSIPLLRFLFYCILMCNFITDSCGVATPGDTSDRRRGRCCCVRASARARQEF